MDAVTTMEATAAIKMMAMEMDMVMAVKTDMMLDIVAMEAMAVMVAMIMMAMAMDITKDIEDMDTEDLLMTDAVMNK